MAKISEIGSDIPPTLSPLTMSSSAEPESPYLPIEIQSLIISKLERAQLAIIPRVSTTFYHIATPVLYEAISINLAPHPDLSNLILADEAPLFAADMRSSDSSTTFTPLTSRSNPLPDRFSFTKRLTVTIHRNTVCKSFAPLVMPRLSVLTVIRGAPESLGFDACYCQHYDAHLNSCGQEPCCRCSLLRQLLPKKVLFSGVPPYSFDFGINLWTLPPSLPSPSPSMTTIDVLVGELSLIGYPIIPTLESVLWTRDTSGWALFDNLPSTVRRLTLVVGTSGWGWADASQYDIPYDSHDRAMDNADGMIGSLQSRVESLARACCGKSRIIEIVGLEAMQISRPTITSSGLLGPGLQHQNTLRLAIVRYLVLQGWSAGAARERADSVVFSTMPVESGDGFSFQARDRKWGWVLLPRAIL